MMFSSLFAGVQAAFTNVLLAIFPVAAAVVGVLVALRGLVWMKDIIRGAEGVDEEGGRWGDVGIDGMSYQVLDNGVTVIRDRNGDEFAAVSADGDTVVYAADLDGAGDGFDRDGEIDAENYALYGRSDREDFKDSEKFQEYESLRGEG